MSPVLATLGPLQRESGLIESLERILREERRVGEGVESFLGDLEEIRVRPGCAALPESCACLLRRNDAPVVINGAGPLVRGCLKQNPQNAFYPG